MRRIWLTAAFFFALVGYASAVTCPSNITGTISPTSCWPIIEGSGTAITDTLGVNSGTLGGSGFTWVGNDLSCDNTGGSGCNISTPTTYSNPQPLTVVFSFAGTNGPILQFAATSATTATPQFYIAYLDNFGHLTWGVNNYSVLNVLQTNTSYADGNKHVGVASIGAAGMKLYIDGTLVGQRNVQLANYSAGQWLIGGATIGNPPWPYSPTASYFNGTIYYAAWLNGTQVTDAQGQAITGTSVSPIGGVSTVTLTGTIGSMDQTVGFVCMNNKQPCHVDFTIGGIQRPNTGDFIIIPSPPTVTCLVDSGGNLIGPNGLYSACKLPQGAHVTMQASTNGQPVGQPVSLIMPFQSSVDIATLILAQTDPASVITQIATAGPYGVGVTVTNPATGQVGVATITWPNCNKVSTSAGAYALDTSTATCQVLTLGGSSTITPTGLIDSQPDTVYIVQDGTGGRAPTFAAPVGDTLVWISQSPNTIQPTLPTTGANTITRWSFTLNGTVIYGKLDNAIGTGTTGAANTVLTGQGVNTPSVFSAIPTLGTNGGTGGKITLNGATSGSAALKVAAAAGSSADLTLPTTSGSGGNVLSTDGAGALSWIGTGSFPVGTDLFFGGNCNGNTQCIATSVPFGIMKATRALTFDNGTIGWNGWTCITYPFFAIYDVTGGAEVSTKQIDGVGSTGTAMTSVTPAVSSGDILAVELSPAHVGTSCSVEGLVTVGGVFH